MFMHKTICQGCFCPFLKFELCQKEKASYATKATMHM